MRRILALTALLLPMHLVASSCSKKSREREPCASTGDCQSGLSCVADVCINKQAFVAQTFSVATEIKNHNATMARMKSIKKQVGLYYTMFDRYPSSLQDLVEPPNGRKPLMNKKEVRDLWGTPFKYDSRRQGDYISSAGPDLEHDNADDITLDTNEVR